MKLRSLISLLAVALTVAASAQESVMLSFRNTDVRDVLALYERLTGCHLVVDNQVIGTLSVTAPAPVSSAKAIELIEAALFSNSFPIVQIKPDTIQIIGLGKSVRSAAVPTITRPEDLPAGERVVTYVYKFKFREPKEIAEVLYRHFGSNSMGTPSWTVDESVRAIIITDRTSSLRSIIKLLGELDQPKTR